MPRIRSIPAGAGEPRGSGGPHGFHRVYPRGGGGTPVTDQLPSPLEGLSPRGRGNRVQMQRETLPEGSIPAGAGEPIG